MDIKEIISKKEYLIPSRYISGRIIEYDMKSANISVLMENKVITDNQYSYLANLPKDLREKEVGLMERKDPSIYTSIATGIKEAKIEFAGFNKLVPEQILRVANDAVYVNTVTDLKFTKFGDYIEFRPKNEYNVFCKLGSVIILCRFDPDGNIHIDIKGIGKNDIYHREYMIYTIMSTITLIERSGVRDAIDYLYEICEAYLRLELPVGYYREFNSESLFRFKYNIGGMTTCATAVYESNKPDLDINYNYTVLRELWSILVEQYTMQK